MSATTSKPVWSPETGPDHLPVNDIGATGELLETDAVGPGDETLTAANTPPPLNNAMATRAGIKTRGRRTRCLSVDVAAGACGGPGGPGGGFGTSAGAIGASWVSWTWMAAGWVIGMGAVTRRRCSSLV